MATNFPASLDSLTNPTSSDSLNSPSHSAQHANVNDAVEALEAKVGADSSAVTTSHDYKIAQLEAGATGGKILQVVSAIKTDTFSAAITGNSDTLITGLSVSITPSSTSSKILIFGMVHGSGYSTNNSVSVRAYRDSTMIGVGTSPSNRVASTAANTGDVSDAPEAKVVNVGIVLEDLPTTTSATTYKLHLTTWGTGTSQTYYVNRSSSDSDNVGYPRPVSSIMVMEVAA